MTFMHPTPTDVQSHEKEGKAWGVKKEARREEGAKAALGDRKVPLTAKSPRVLPPLHTPSSLASSPARRGKNPPTLQFERKALAVPGSLLRAWFHTRLS